MLSQAAIRRSALALIEVTNVPALERLWNLANMRLPIFILRRWLGAALKRAAGEAEDIRSLAVVPFLLAGHPVPRGVLSEAKRASSDSFHAGFRFLASEAAEGATWSALSGATRLAAERTVEPGSLGWVVREAREAEAKIMLDDLRSILSK